MDSISTANVFMNLYSAGYIKGIKSEPTTRKEELVPRFPWSKHTTCDINHGDPSLLIMLQDRPTTDHRLICLDFDNPEEITIPRILKMMQYPVFITKSMSGKIHVYLLVQNHRDLKNIVLDHPYKDKDGIELFGHRDSNKLMYEPNRELLTDENPKPITYRDFIKFLKDAQIKYHIQRNYKKIPNTNKKGKFKTIQEYLGIPDKWKGNCHFHNDQHASAHCNIPGFYNCSACGTWVLRDGKPVPYRR